LGQHELAVQESLQAIKLCRQVDDRLGEVYAQDYLGQVYANLGQPAAAHSAWSEALATARSVNHPLVEKLEKQLTG
jgi:hypothetical protein